MPSHAIPLTISRDDGYRELVYTDASGKFRMPTPKNQTLHYVVTIESDRQTYGATTAVFTIERSSPNQVNIFLNPLPAAKRSPNGVVDVAEVEDNIPARARSAYKQGMEAVQAGETDAAIRDLQRAISFYPQYVRALNDLGVVYMKLDQLDAAAKNFRQAMEINKRYFHPRMNLGIVLRKQGRYSEALEIIEPLYNENRGMLEVCQAYAKALIGVGRLADAEKVYRSTLEAKSLTPEARAALQSALGVSLNRQSHYSEAVPEFEKAIAIDDRNANTHFELGSALLQLQQLDRAEQELLRAYELGGHSAGGAQLLLGQIYFTQKKFDAAQRAFEQYLRDVPAAPNAAQISQLITELKRTPRN